MTAGMAQASLRSLISIRVYVCVCVCVLLQSVLFYTARTQIEYNTVVETTTHISESATMLIRDRIRENV